MKKNASQDSNLRDKNIYAKIKEIQFRSIAHSFP